MAMGSGKKALHSSVMATLLCGNALAVDMTLDYEKKLKAVSAISPMSVDTASGELISLYSGGLSFRVVDVSLPGNSGLPVELARTWQNDLDTRNRIKSFEDWELDVPYISSPVSKAYGWVVGPERLPLNGTSDLIDTMPVPTGTTHTLTKNRCGAAVNFSSPQNELSYLNIMPPSFEVVYAKYAPPTPQNIYNFTYDYKQIINTSQYWNGYQVNLPGEQRRPLLIRSAENQNLPSAQHLWITENNMAYRCIPDDADGEGFLGIAADGTQYYFDHLAYHTMRDAEVRAADPGPPSLNPEFPEGGNGGDSSGWASSVATVMRRSEARLYASKIVDRFGNWVAFSYTGSKLTRISAKDGREMEITYNSRGAIAQVTAAGRSWTYGYTQAPLDPSGFGGTPGFNQTFLTSVTNPDGSQWKYDLVRLGRNQLYHSENQTYYENPEQACLPYGAEPPIFVYPGTERMEGTVETPSGLRYRYTVSPKRHNITYARGAILPLCSLAGEPRYFDALSLIEKRVEGPGLQPLLWQFSYTQTPAKFISECADASSCGTRKSVDVTQPDGTLRRHYFGVRADQNLGMALGHEVIDNGVVKHREMLDYRFWPEGAPYPARIGHSILLEKNESLDHHFAYSNPPVISPGTALIGRLIPINAKTTQRDGVTFTSSTNAFDQFSRPISITRANTLGQTKTETTTYLDNLSEWVLGLPLTSSVNGTEVSRTEYNAQSLPWKTYRFGKLQQTLSYWSDGNVNTVTDGRNNTISLGDYYRGIPRLIGHPATPEAPAGATESATVDPNGWITSVTDEIGAKTCYGYDPMGRLASILYPSEAQPGVCDDSRWSSVSLSFMPVNHDEHGLPAGHWRASRHEGNKRVNTYYDALWRPVLEEAFDAFDVAATVSQVVKKYDTSGRLSFQSYPANNVGHFADVTQGTRTFYDALDRVTRVEQDSEHGVLATTTEYLTNLQTRVVNPRGQATVTAFMAWDQPMYDLPIASVQPEGKVIEIARHPQFGWPLQLKQRSADNTLQQIRKYVYDDHAQLCKTIEPETGATVMGYDEANNLTHTWAGLNLPDPDSCNHAEAWQSGRLVWRRYTARNQVDAIRFPDGRGDQNIAYTPDGLQASVTSFNDANYGAPVITAYTYNKRRLLTGESSSQPGWYTWSLGYEYDPIGNLRWQSYPTGLTVDYVPNALGQATQVRNAHQSSIIYASGASYYPNGAMKQFTYGNGIVHTMTQNARQLPRRVTSSGGVLDYEYNYDANGNPTHIANMLVPGYDPQDRWMGFDGLDRLTVAASASFGGDHWHRFSYDALDNIKSWTLPGVKDYAEYVYDPQNRLTGIRNTAGATVIGIGYDAQGNLQNKNGQTYEFDYGNRLRGVTGKEYYRYDGLGRRILNWRYPSGTLSLSQYSQSGQLMYQEDDQRNLRVEHIYLGGSLITEREIAWSTGAVALKYQHTDALGSPVAVTNEAGAVIERNDYEPYGAIIGKPNYNGIGYTGHMMDGATGLTYMQQRYYDQSVGRFLSVDPVTADSVTGSNFNRYWYANNNPYKFTDPDGRIAETLWDAANVVIGAVSAYNNFSDSNIGAGLVDVGGVVVDAAATIIPIVPGGAGTAIKVARGGDQALQAVKAGDRVSGVATGTGRAADRAALRNAGVPTSQSRSDVKGPGGSQVPKAERQQMTRDSRGNPVVVSRHQPHPQGKQPHDSKPHSHAATPRIEGGQTVKRKDGSVRYHD